MDIPPFKKSLHIGVPILNWKLFFLYGSARKKKLYSSQKNFLTNYSWQSWYPKKPQDNQFPDV